MADYINWFTPPQLGCRTLSPLTASPIHCKSAIHEEGHSSIHYHCSLIPHYPLIYTSVSFKMSVPSPNYYITSIRQLSSFNRCNSHNVISGCSYQATPANIPQIFICVPSSFLLPASFTPLVTAPYSKVETVLSYKHVLASIPMFLHRITDSYFPNA